MEKTVQRLRQLLLRQIDVLVVESMYRVTQNVLENV